MGVVSPVLSQQQRPVLVVEDSENDALLIQRQLRINGVTNPIIVLGSGDEAMVYLSGIGKYSDRAAYPLPFVMLLDLNLRGSMDGLGVLKWARSTRGLEDLLIIVISGLEDPSVIREAYRLGANSYLMKPANGEEIRNLLRGFSRYWMYKSESADATTAQS